MGPIIRQLVYRFAYYLRTAPRAPSPQVRSWVTPWGGGCREVWGPRAGPRSRSPAIPPNRGSHSFCGILRRSNNECSTKVEIAKQTSLYKYKYTYRVKNNLRVAVQINIKSRPSLEPSKKDLKLWSQNRPPNRALKSSSESEVKLVSLRI